MAQDIAINILYGFFTFIAIFSVIGILAFIMSYEVGATIIFSILFLISIIVVGTIVRFVVDSEFKNKVFNAPVAQWQRPLIQNQSSASSSLARSTKNLTT